MTRKKGSVTLPARYAGGGLATPTGEPDTPIGEPDTPIGDPAEVYVGMVEMSDTSFP